MIQEGAQVGQGLRAVAHQGVAQVDGAVPDVPISIADQVPDVVDVRVQSIRDQSLLHLGDDPQHDAEDRRDDDGTEEEEHQTQFEAYALEAMVLHNAHIPFSPLKMPRSQGFKVRTPRAKSFHS